MRSYVLRLAILSGLIYGIGTTVVSGSPGSPLSFAAEVFARGAIFGGFMAAMTVIVVRRAGRPDARPGRALAEGSVTLAVPAAEAERICTEAVAALDGAMVVKAGTKGGRVRLYVSPSWKSFGERVDLEITGDDHRSTVSIISRSAARFTLVDWGRNADNVRRLETWLEDAAVARRRSDPVAADPVRPGAGSPSRR